jgi:hypothetical protein
VAWRHPGCFHDPILALLRYRLPALASLQIGSSVWNRELTLAWETPNRNDRVDAERSRSRVSEETSGGIVAEHAFAAERPSGEGEGVGRSRGARVKHRGLGVSRFEPWRL